MSIYSPSYRNKSLSLLACTQTSLPTVAKQRNVRVRPNSTWETAEYVLVENLNGEVVGMKLIFGERLGDL